jgi:hypothetical protein
MFAVATLRSLKSPSGISGASTRASITTNSARPAAEVGEQAERLADVQPCLVAVHDRVDREHRATPSR